MLLLLVLLLSESVTTILLLVYQPAVFCRILKVPKREIFVTELNILSDPI